MKKQNKTKKQKGDFLEMLFGTLGDICLEICQQKTKL